MSLYFGKDGNTIAMIKDNSNYIKNNTLSITADNIEDDFKVLKLNKGYFQPIGNWNSERSCNYIVGASGSGKSRYICEWVKEYKKKYKKNPVYVFSSLDEDVSLEPIKPLRILLDNEFIDEKIDLTMYKDSCCIFDDVEVIANKKIKDKVYSIMNLMLNTGRHHNITVWCVNHTATGTKQETKTVLNEAHTITYFPANHNRQLVYMLENYCGLDNKQLKFLRSLNSRWVTIYKMYPQCIITDKMIFMMSEINK